MLKIKLSSEESTQLKALHKKIKNRSEADRIKAILLLSCGHKRKTVANILLVDEDTITNWKYLFLNRKDLQTWYKSNYKPYQGKLTDSIIEQTVNMVENQIFVSGKELQNELKKKKRK